MNFTDFIPFYPKRDQDRLPPVPFDVERALQVEVHAHPSLTRQRAANGDLILTVERQMHPAEAFVARFLPVNRRRRIVLDKCGEFMLEACLTPGTRLAAVAERLATEFQIGRDKARQGVILLVKDLLLRGFVFLVRK